MPWWIASLLNSILFNTFIRKITHFSILMLWNGFLSGTIFLSVHAELYINTNGPIVLRSIVDTRQGFSFKFRTCTSGTLLFQGNEASHIQVKLTSTNIATFSSLIFSWKVDDYIENVEMKGYPSFDQNQLFEVKLLTAGTQRPIFSVTGTINMSKTIWNTTLFRSKTISAPLYIGSYGFVGCLYDGIGVNLSTAINSSTYQHKCPLDDGFPCEGKGKSAFF